MRLPLLRLVALATLSVTAATATPSLAQSQLSAQPNILQPGRQDSLQMRQAQPARNIPGPTPTQNQDPQQAQTAALPGRGLLPEEGPQNLPEPSRQEMDEALNAYRICNNGGAKMYFDCNCVSTTYLQLRVIERVKLRTAGAGKRSDGFMIQEQALKSCPNSPALAGNTYTMCKSWAPRMFDDAEGFCSCYANTYARTFAKTPTNSIFANRDMMKASMSSCNAGDAALRAIEREHQVRDLKRAGLYDDLFPSARASGLATTEQAPPKAKPTDPIVLQLHERLLAPDTAPRIPARQ